ncbi:stalk domain-containing protein [Paenibacillus sp. FSL R7-0272]|uniref:stalk domain-containing protein n=1 Tax=Paenibacillus sp. FSL R7-0272 TaxID=2921679 RepID=UPI0030EC290A
MYSDNHANHVTTEKALSSSLVNPARKQQSASLRRFSKIIISASVVSTLIIATLPSVSTTYAAKDEQAFTGNAPDRAVSASSSGSSPKSSLTSNTAQELHYTQVAGGYYYTVALRSDGSVWTWGRNLLGELGISDTVRYRHTFSPVRIPHLTNVTAISNSGGGDSLAVQADGTVWQWGDGRTPSQVHGITNARGVTAGPFTSVALLQDGTVQSWQTPPQKLPNMMNEEAGKKPTLHRISGLKNVVQTTLSGYDGYALKKDGSVWTWKEADKAGSPPSKAKPVKGLTNITFITGKGGQLIALDSKGRVWRMNAQGKPIPYHHELKVKTLDASSYYVLLVTTKGEVYSFGKTVTGKQGKIKQLSDIKEVSAGYYHSLALSSDGNIWGWGGDKYQEAGAPATSSGGMVYIPVQAKLGTDIYVNGKLLQSVYPAVETSGTLQLPIKTIALALGATFEVHTAEGLISHYTLIYNDRIITIKPNELQYTVSTLNKLDPQEEQVISLREPIGNYSGATTAPYDMFQELGLDVTWDSNTAKVTIDEVK